MGNTGLLAVITVLLFGIFTVLFIQANEPSPSEQVADSISNTIEEIGDEIDDNTDAR